MNENDARQPPELAIQVSPDTPGLGSDPALRQIFFGPNGLRAGWRLLTFTAIICFLFILLGVALSLLSVAGGNRAVEVSMLTPSGLGISEGTIFLLACIATAVMARVERRKFGEYGLPIRSALGKNFWAGTFAGFVAISGTLLAIYSLHGFRITGLAIHGSTIPLATAAWAVTSLTVGLSEEFAFRGYAQFTLTTGMGFWPSAFLSSVAFGLVHVGNKGETKFGLVSVVLFGLLFCLFLRRTGNLWWAVGFHAGWDWGQTFFYGVPDSGVAPYHNLFGSVFQGSAWLTGGTVGPEASVFTPIALLIVAVIFSRRYREVRYSPSKPNVVAEKPEAVTALSGL